MINGSDMITMSVISLIGTIVVTQLLNHNWFKRQQLKEYYYGMRQNKNIDFEKFKINRRITSKQLKIKKPDLSPIDWIDKLKGVNPDTLHTLVDTFAGSNPEEVDLLEGTPSEGNIEDTVINLVKENPSIISKFLKGAGGGSDEGKNQNYL